MTHVSTQETFRAGIEQEPQLCCFCNHKTVYLSWVDASCDTCCNTYSNTIGRALMSMREKLKLTRKQLGLKLGYNTTTIKSYEWKIPSKVYVDKFRQFIKKQYEVTK